MKITLDTAHIWLIRRVSDSRVDFWTCRRISQSSPMAATWFIDKEAAEHTIYDIEHEPNFYKLETDEFEVVSLAEAMRPFLGVSSGSK